MDQKIINFCGLSRSGNHAVIFWAFHNVSEKVFEINNHQIYVGDNICFFNNCDYHTKYRDSFDLSVYPTVIKSYEDKEMPDSFVIIRDFMNLICSRYKLYGKALSLDKNYCQGLSDIISLWKQHVISKNLIFYNKWLISCEYRNEVGKMVGIPNVKDETSYVSNLGQGSSFGGIRLYNPEDYLTRSKMVDLPKDMVDKILGDNELIKMNKELFEIDLNLLSSFS